MHTVDCYVRNKKSSRRRGHSRSFWNPYINGKDVFIISENFENVKSGYKKDKQSELFGWEGPVPGSATDIASRNREAEKKKELQKSEELMEEMKSDFPQLKNIYEILKGKGN